jgi:hypothetical protein
MAKKRFQETVNLQPGIVSSGAAQGMASLSQRLQEFKQLGAGVAQMGFEARAEKEIQKGVEQAEAVEQRDEKGKLKQPEFQESGLFDRHKTQAYNETLGAAYQASLNNDNREKLKELYLKNESNVLAFNDSAKKYFQGVVAEVDPYIRADVAADLEQGISLYREKVQTNQFKKDELIAVTEIEKDAMNAKNTALKHTRNKDNKLAAYEIGKLDAELQKLVDRGKLTEGQAEVQKRNFLREVDDQTFLGNVDIIANEDLKKAMAFVDSKADKTPGRHTPDEWRRTIIEAQENINRKFRRNKEERSSKIKKFTEEQYLSLGKRIYDGEIIADPQGKFDKRGVDAYYKVKNEEWNQLEPAEQYKQRLDYVKRCSVMPSQLKRAIGASMRDGNESQVLAYSMFIEDLAETPNAQPILSDISRESRAIGQMVYDLYDNGVDLDKAVETARRNVSPKTESEKVRIADEIKTYRKKYDNWLKKEMDTDPQFDPWGGLVGLFKAEPKLSANMLADYTVNFETFMQDTGGNVEQSKKLAYSALKNVWATTTIGGKRLQKYGPESFYAVTTEENNDWMTDQFNKEMKAAGYNPKKLQLTVNREDLRSSEMKWDVEFFNPKTSKTSVLFKWRPDYKLSDAYKKTAMKNVKLSTTAKKMQQRYKQIKNLEDIGLKEEKLYQEFLQERITFKEYDEATETLRQAKTTPKEKTKGS